MQEAARGHGGYNAAMNAVLSFLGFALAAFYVWLGVRALNGRETWALRTALVLTGLLVAIAVVFFGVFFILSTGPRKWFFA